MAIYGKISQKLVEEGRRRHWRNARRRQRSKKRSLPPQLIVGTGRITAGLRKGGEESLPSDLKIPPQGSEHVLGTR
jgi:hypothetical protein